MIGYYKKIFDSIRKKLFKPGTYSKCCIYKIKIIYKILNTNIN